MLSVNYQHQPEIVYYIKPMMVNQPRETIKLSSVQLLQFKKTDQITSFRMNPQFSSINIEDLIETVKSVLSNEALVNQKSVQSKYILSVESFSYSGSYFTMKHEKYEKNLKEIEEDLSFKKKMMIIYSIAQALQVLQKQNIMHNFVCPSSISICRESKIDIQAKLNYFFYSKKVSGLNKNMKKDFRHKQSNDFHSPQYKNKDKINSKSDIWSLGALYYYFIFGTVSGISILENEVKIKVPQGTPSWICSIFKNLLAFNPQNRYDINRVCHLFKSAIVCARQTQKCLKGISLKKITTITA